MVYCSTPCLDDVGNYVVVYPGYNEDGRPDKLCGSFSYRKLYIPGLYAYVKLHTNSEVNSDGLKGFSKVEFTAVGLYAYLYNKELKITNHFRYQRVYFKLL